MVDGATEGRDPGAAYAAVDRALLLDLARRSVVAAALGQVLPPLPPNLPAHLLEPRGVFVTLERGDALRGCIGHIFPREPLALAVVHNARSATVHDPRFSPVAPDEVASLSIHISVLTVPLALAFSSGDELITQLRPGLDGVVLELDDRRATFLPQVWERLPDPEVFLDRLAVKAGAKAGAWRAVGARVHTYRAEVFGDEPGRPNPC